MYCYKMEVAIRSTKPHIALFLNDLEPGATHDFEIFKTHSQQYNEYLSSGQDKFAMLGDLGYVGQSQRSYDFITPVKKPLTIEARALSSAVHSVRYLVEQFFGKVKGFFPVLASRYTFSRQNISLDARICTWLTNELIVMHGVDLAFYLKSLNPLFG